jgi:hypothetical protein
MSSPMEGKRGWIDSRVGGIDARTRISVPAHFQFSFLQSKMEEYTPDHKPNLYPTRLIDVRISTNVGDVRLFRLRGGDGSLRRAARSYP